MGNIKNFNFDKLKLQISNSDYWDFYLANDESSSGCDSLSLGSCFVVWYDFNNPDTFLSGSTNNIHSLVSWTGATNTGYTLNTIGLTGIDNGLITFDKQSGDTTNQALLSALTTSALVIESGDNGLIMNRVTGTTSGLTYTLLPTSGPEGEYIQFLGGFYQGFFKLDGYSYEVLPTRVNQSWGAEFWLKPEDIDPVGTTLNDLYPNNKGFFFYMGTRAENKFWNQFYGADTGCTSACTATACTSGETVSEWCTIPKETDITIVGDYGIGIPLSPPQVTIDLITNQFLIYGRGSGRKNFETYTGDTGSLVIHDESHEIYNPNCRCSRCNGPMDGLGSKHVCNYDGKGIAVARTRMVISNENNPFLVYGRAALSGGCSTYCHGPNDGFGNQTVHSFSGFSKPMTELDYKLDIIDNALGFRITDDGKIGYRLLTVTGGCQTINNERVYVSGITIAEKYSLPDMVNFDEWNYIVIKFVTDYKDDCDLKTASRRKGKLMFYVNAKLKFVVNDFDEFIAKRLQEYKDKQIGVPFNFSLGGGSQGLMESQTFDGLDPRDRDLPIETNFAGTFVGSISQFKYNICELKYCNILENYNAGLNQYGLSTTNYLLTENEFDIVTEDDENISLE